MPKYQCKAKDCLLTFSKWKNCSKHLLESGHIGSQQLCCIDEKAVILPQPAQYKCSVCNVLFTRKNYKNHIEATGHPRAPKTEHSTVVPANKPLNVQKTAAPTISITKVPIVNKKIEPVHFDSVEQYNSIKYGDITQKANATNRQTEQYPSLYTYMTSQATLTNLDNQSVVLADEKIALETLAESALLGYRHDATASNPRLIHINVHEPFCLVTCGVQGSGKSHTLSVILENCLVSTLKCTKIKDQSIVRLQNPMCALVFHYDQNPRSICESTGLIISREGLLNQLSVPRNSMTVLVSPSFYLQRRAFYGNYCTVRPILFKWASLSADHIKKLMCVNDGDNQLYMASLLDLLRSYQKSGSIPSFDTFLTQVVQQSDVRGQQAPLLQRLALLQSFVYESAKNAIIRNDAIDIESVISSGNLIVADLTDPLLSKSEANGVFQLLVEKFRVYPHSGCGKVLALDEAHKFMDGTSSDGLSTAILDTARLMRHDGIRVVVSTQSPRALLPEFLELVSIAVLHRFHSRDWMQYLCEKIDVGKEDFERIRGLIPGAALVFATRHRMVGCESLAPVVQIRPRMTANRGASRMNQQNEVVNTTSANHNIGVNYLQHAVSS
ncbi:hypothetical protein HK100_001961 [Physocladia obscura]|uniref:C2H2-type domain-containing protein n=1 Tax=Physocladia obscura TaxID=109957 RepID=A0AAD5XE62_9FUNG|nr:hypothetical protein HK100_001961 [Physocladia obscura]